MLLSSLGAVRADDLPTRIDRRCAAARPASPERPEIEDRPSLPTVRLVRCGARAGSHGDGDADDDRDHCKGCATHDVSFVSSCIVASSVASGTEHIHGRPIGD